MPDTSAQPEFQIESLSGAHESERILKLRGPLVISNFFTFQQMAREDKSQLLIVDMTDVPYVDSAALGAIIGVHVSTGNNKRKYALVGIAPRIMTMLTVSGVRDTLVIFPTVAEAEAALL